jgi:tRNA (guanosine-2'-O-)-methyltransferase
LPSAKQKDLSPEQRHLLTEHFSQYISDHKKDFIERVLHQRTRHITVVIEDIFQSQNASAVIRTCECMGVQDVHIVENASKYSVNPKVLKGSNKWLDLIRYKKKNENNTAACFDALRRHGYKILVTSPSSDGMELNKVPLISKLAIVMGNELDGASKFALENADQLVTIPMFGFTESYNISVSAAICLNTLVAPLRNLDISWQLSEEEMHLIRLQWYRGVVKRSDIIEREFLKAFGI